MKLDKTKIDALKAIKNSNLLIKLIQESVQDNPETAVELLNELGDNLESLGGIDLSQLEHLKGQDGKTPVFGEDYMTTDEIDGLERFIKQNTDDIGLELSSRLEVALKSAQNQINKAVATIKNGKDGKNGKDVTKADITEVLEKYKDELKGSPDSPLEVVEKIKKVRGSKRLGFKNVRGLPELEKKVINNSDDIDDLKKEIDRDIEIAVSRSGSSGGSATFTGLTDTPANYTGQAGMYAKVNAGETGLEFDTATGGGETNTGVNVGTGAGEVFKQKTGVNLELKTIKAGTGVTVTNGTSDITITASGSGESNTASNVGAEKEVFKQKTGVDLEFRTLKAGSGITLTENTNDIEIVATGGGTGDMTKAVYDPTTVNGDAFDMENMTEGATKKILTSAERTILSNTSGTNTGDQDLSTYQLKPAEGAFVDGDKTKLDGIEAGAEVNNIGDVNATDLTDAGDSTLHYHTTDRDRANHTGTQTASTINDFDTEVANNTAVTANTAKTGVTDEISNIVEDTTPQLGGDLELNSNEIKDSNGSTGTDGQVLTADGAGKNLWEDASSGGGNTITKVASGALANGDKVILNSDGKVEVVSGQTVGSEVVFASAQTNDISAAFDSSNNKIVVAYKDVGNSNYGTAIIGTVSGTSISFGTEVVFNTAATTAPNITFNSNANKVVIAFVNVTAGAAVVGTVSGTSISFGTVATFSASSTGEPKATFDSNLNKVVISYRDSGGSDYGTAIVGTVSGTSISFGTAVIFNAGTTYYQNITFDSNLNKVVIAYNDYTGSNYGRAVVGTISGTSISFGTVATFNSAATSEIYCAFDSNLNKVVIAYKDDGNSKYGTAIVGTVSGTSITFGLEVVFNAGETYTPSVVFDSNLNKIIIAYQDTVSSSRGTLIMGTVSGTVIGFGSEVIFNNATTNYIATAFDSNLNKVVIAYQDAGNSNYGTAIIFKNANLSEHNFLGISDGAYADGATATIQKTGATDDAQSGLTTGKGYYVQGDNTLDVTPGSISVYAGLALSATEILIKE